MTKKRYVAPEVTTHGDIRAVTRGFGRGFQWDGIWFWTSSGGSTGGSAHS